jgi:hypothetical protein
MFRDVCAGVRKGCASDLEQCREWSKNRLEQDWLETDDARLLLEVYDSVDDI